MRRADAILNSRFTNSTLLYGAGKIKRIRQALVPGSVLNHIILFKNIILNIYHQGKKTTTI